MARSKLSALFVTSEAAPLVKTGGLADVSGSLPVALMYQGVDVRVLMPGYPAVMEGVKSKGRLASLPALGELPGSQLLILPIWISARRNLLRCASRIFCSASCTSRSNLCSSSSNRASTRWSAHELQSICCSNSRRWLRHSSSRA